MRKATIAAALIGAMAGWLVPGGQAAADSPIATLLAYQQAGGYEGHKNRVGGRAFTRIPREVVSYDGKYRAGTIVIDTAERRLYYVMGDGKAMKYGIGVGRPGFEWAGTHRVTRKAEWPGWTPPPPMRKRQPGLPAHLPGGPNNPLGARALYLGSTWYRIHGSNEPWTIGSAVSSGCIRMTNEDVIELYEKADVGTQVVVLR
jgi:lipoprotein-anchoring transpeptidase ErfK/SrfK